MAPMHEGKPTIRKAMPSDGAGILECLRAAFEPYRPSYTREAFFDTVLTLETLQQRLAAMTLFVAVSEASVIVGTIGCSVVSCKDASSVMPREGHIRGMAVLPSWQGSGVALQLLQAVESELRAHGCSKISLDTTEPLQPAIRFYLKHGYRRSGKVTDFFGMPLLEYVKTSSE